MSNLVSTECIEFIKKFEGFSATVYLDMVGVPTLGYGMTGKEIKGLKKVTEEQATEMLTKLVNENYAHPLKLNLDLRRVKLNQHEFDALVSMAYNVGVQGVIGSTLYRNITAGIRNVDIITSNFQMWSKAGGKFVQGLHRRRTEEAKMFFKAVKGVVPKSGKVTAKVLNVRNEASASSGIIGQLHLGDSVKINKKVGEWYDIYFGNHGGYVHSKYIK